MGSSKHHAVAYAVVHGVQMKEKPIGVDPLAYSVAEFCKAHPISRATFYNLKKLNQAPAIMRAGRRVLISVEAARAWREQRTQAWLSENQ